jgi:hypothetical protein
MSNRYVLRRTLTAATALALAVAVSACGSDDDNDGADNNEPSGTPTQQVEQTLDQSQQAIIAGDGETYCSSLTAAGRASVAAYGRRTGRGATCAQTIATNARLAKTAGIKQQPTRVLSVKINGNTAIAKITDGGRSATKMRLTRESDGWKRPAPKYPTSIPKPTNRVPPFNASKDPAKQVRRLIHLRDEIERRPNRSKP